MKKSTCLVLSAALASTILLSACGDGNTAKTDINLDSYPIETDTTLTYWMALDSSLNTTVTNYGDTFFAKELAERTGVNVKYIHPTLGQEGEAFNLMVASNDLPDMIEATWSGAMAGGPVAALNGQVIIPLNDLMEKYAPALSKYLSDNPDMDREVKLDDNQYYAFPHIRGDSSLLVSAGPIIRQDWLDELGIAAPKTIDDWENMLTAFKEKKGAIAPFSIASTQREAMFAIVGSGYNFYVDGKSIKFAPLEPEFKTAVETLHRWFEKGLLDPNYTLVDSTLLDSNILNGFTGATYGSGGSNLGKWLASSGNENIDLVGISMPLNQHGETNEFSRLSNYYSTYGSAITTACKNPELAAKYLDYNYTEDGAILNNFGVEGTTFDYIDDYPTYKDVIMKNPDGLTTSQAMANYFRASRNGPFVQDKRYIMQYYALDRQKEALSNWEQGSDIALANKIPNIVLLSNETSEYSNIFNEIKKYRDESVVAFINGTKSMDQFDDFVQTLEKMNAKRAVEIQQAAYDRYLNRK